MRACVSFVRSSVRARVVCACVRSCACACACVRACARARVCVCVRLATAGEKEDPSLQRGGRLFPPPVKMIIDWSPLAVVEVLLEATSSSKEAPASIHLRARMALVYKQQGAVCSSARVRIHADGGV